MSYVFPNDPPCSPHPITKAPYLNPYTCSTLPSNGSICYSSCCLCMLRKRYYPLTWTLKFQECSWLVTASWRKCKSMTDIITWWIEDVLPFMLQYTCIVGYVAAHYDNTLPTGSEGCMYEVSMHGSRPTTLLKINPEKQLTPSLGLHPCPSSFSRTYVFTNVATVKPPKKLDLRVVVN